jgi:hypothetical protein
MPAWHPADGDVADAAVWQQQALVWSRDATGKASLKQHRSPVQSVGSAAWRAAEALHCTFW